MPKYLDTILVTRKAKLEEYTELIRGGRLNASVGWPISRLKQELQIHIALADLGVHHIYKGVCNCGLVVTRYPKTGHRYHNTNEPVRNPFRLTIDIGENHFVK